MLLASRSFVVQNPAKQPKLAQVYTRVPAPLQEIVEDFQALTEPERLELLLEFSRSLPALPERLRDHPELMEQVVECQSPLSLHVERGEDDRFLLFFSAPAEAPTTRGFASVIFEGLNGLSGEEILGTPDDLPHYLGLDRAITPLRVRGMTAMLGRIKRGVRAFYTTPETSSP